MVGSIALLLCVILAIVCCQRSGEGTRAEGEKQRRKRRKGQRDASRLAGNGRGNFQQSTLLLHQHQDTTDMWIGRNGLTALNSIPGIDYTNEHPMEDMQRYRPMAMAEHHAGSPLPMSHRYQALQGELKLSVTSNNLPITIFPSVFLLL